MARKRGGAKPKKYDHMFSLMVTFEQMDKLIVRSQEASIEEGKSISIAEIVRRIIDAA